MRDSGRNKLRYNLINLIMYIAGIVLVIRLFDYQVVHGEEYRQMSNNRLTREVTVTPTRGRILDRTGIEIVGNTMGFELQLYKSKIDVQTLNNTILKTIQLLEENGDTYINTIPINLDTFEFTISEDNLVNWKKKNRITDTATAEEAINILATRYNVQTENMDEIKKIVAIRYRIQTEGYSTMNPLIISKNISRKLSLSVRYKLLFCFN